MRVTNSMYYENLYGKSHNSLNSKLFDVNKQIASGIKMQYASEDVAAFTETMRLDNEITTLVQVTKSTSSGLKISDQTDTTLNEFTSSMNRVKTLLINAANDTHSDASRDAIAGELRGVEEHLKNLANTSINGQYLFSGSATGIKPISDDGIYNGNADDRNSFTGSKSKQKFNLSGADLFLGEEGAVRREITSNVVQNNLSLSYDFETGIDNGINPTPVTVNDTIRDLMGDTDSIIDTLQKHHFYIRGVQSDGTAFSKQISMSDEDSIEQLLTNIGDSYGNTLNTKVVNVSMNDNGQIVVEDKLKGSSKLDFHMTAAVDYVNGGVAGLDAADINDAVVYPGVGITGMIDNLDGGETNFDTIMREVAATQPAVVLANSLFVKEFVHSNSVASADSTISNIDGLLYDRTLFAKDGSTLSSSTPQIVKSDNSFALDTTKLSEVADTTKGTAITTDDTLAGNKFKLTGTNIHGAAFNVQIDFNSNVLPATGSTFSLDGGVTDYKIFDMGTPRAAVNADDMTYRQLMDTINMVVTDTLPQPVGGNFDPLTGLALTEAEEYDFAVKSSKSTGGTELSYDGKITFAEIGTSNTEAEISLHDANSGDFTINLDIDGDAISDIATSSIMTFNTNNALSVRDPKTDFFKELDLIISAVEDHKTYPDSSVGQIRNIGMQNALKKIDDLSEHVSRSHAEVGANSNALTASIERTTIMEVSARTLRSEVIDTDIAEASLKLTQLSLNYQAMLSTVNKVSQLSLVNYL